MFELASEVLQVAGKAVHDVLFAKIKRYVNYVKHCDENLISLLKNLEELEVVKGDIDDLVLSGKQNLEKLTRKAKQWYAQVRKLNKDERMRKLMNKDMGIAKVMMRLVKDDLKNLVENDGDMRDLAVKVMIDVAKRKRIADIREVSDAEEKDNEVGQVLEKLLEETMEEFKTLMQNDMNMAVAALHLLENHMDNLERLTEKDNEVADIIAKARDMSVDDEWLGDDDHDNVFVHENKLREKVADLLKPVREAILNEELLKALPENVRLGMEAMGIVMRNSKGLEANLMNTDNTTSHVNCCCCVVSYNCFSDRHEMSVAAEAMNKEIDRIIATKPENQDLTRHIRSGEMEAIQTNFLGLESRNDLIRKIVKALGSDDVHALGVFGMGGSGKTTLAKEIANGKAKGVFETTIMVEISESPNIELIQDQIADGLGLKLHNVYGIPQKAIRLCKRLKSGEKVEGRKDDNSKKILIILDNIWKEIDLLQIGIPREYCKLLLTSRQKSVCKAMDVHKDNIFEVGLLNDDEAKDLFQFQVQREVQNGKYKDVAGRLLEKCGGLPLSIVATANSLKGHELSFWRQFVEEMEKPISCQISGARHETFAILRTSYELMASEEKRKFFLLACLSPVGSTVSIDFMMRYGIGLGLFQHVNKLSEAIKQAHTWAEELVSSSMLLEGASEGNVKVHDVVRESTLSFASKIDLNKERHMILVDDIPRWIFEETFNQYTCISLLSQANYARLNGVKAHLLQILLLKGNENHSYLLESNFFQGMTNLKVLELAFMNFEKGLPESMGKLKDLKTLQLLKCNLVDIKLIGELETLLVLSLRRSSLEGLPDEIGKLYNLRLLDMSCCECEEPRIPSNVIARLSNLEGLYLVGSSFTKWGKQSTSDDDTGEIDDDTEEINEADMDELNELKFLNDLEISMVDGISLPTCSQFVKNLDKFQVHVGQDNISRKDFHRVLTISDFDVSLELKKYTCLKALLKKADFLSLSQAEIKNIVPQLDEEGFKDLCYLELEVQADISRICEGKAPAELFLNLRHLRVSMLPILQELLPLIPLPRNLTTLDIFSCPSLIYICSEDSGSPPSNKDDGVDKESDIIELPCLKTLSITAARSLISVVKGSSIDQGFFNNKVKFPSLEELTLSQNDSIIKLWGKESNMYGFQHLKSLGIRHCEKMESIGPLSMFISLVHLESLEVCNCDNIQQVISKKSEGEISDEIITFPKLKLLLIECSKNFECFYDGSSTMKFPRLERLFLANLERMAKFTGCRDQTTFFHEKIEFPRLEKVELVALSDEVMLLWDFDELMANGNHFPMLRQLRVEQIKLPSIVFHSLFALGVDHMYDAKFVISSSENEGCLWTYSQLPKLEVLFVLHCPNSVEQLFENDGSPAMLKFCGQLGRLRLVSTSYMEVICLDPFKSLFSLIIEDTRWEYLFSANGGFKQLPSLEELDIIDCQNLEVMIQGGDKDNDVVFPRLKKLSLQGLSSLSKLSSIPDTPFHFLALEILNLKGCDELETICIGPFVSPRLRELIIEECRELHCLFSGEENQVLEFPCLEKLEIRDCAAIKCFSTRPLKAFKLRELKLQGCAKMEELLLGNANCGADLELPSLEHITLCECPNMKSFSQAVLRAPKLLLLTVDNLSCSLPTSENLNELLRHMAEMIVGSECGSDPEIQIASELDPESNPESDTIVNPELGFDFDVWNL